MTRNIETFLTIEGGVPSGSTVSPNSRSSIAGRSRYRYKKLTSSDRSKCAFRTSKRSHSHQFVKAESSIFGILGGFILLIL